MDVIKTLGLEYSPLKTHKSKNFFEFAKRYFLDGVEISPFPFSALKECQKSVTQMTTLLFEQEKRNFLPSISISKSISLFTGICLNLPSRLRKKNERQAELCEGVLKTIHGLIPINQFINELIKKNNLRLPVLSEDVCKNIFMNVTVQAFADSNIMQQINVHAHNFPLTRLA
jgi:hypothetical protein